MKKLYLGVLFHIISFMPLPVLAQLNNGGINAYFGIDGDTRANYVKYGPLTGLIPSDDWFSYTPGTISVIDTTNASSYLAALQGVVKYGIQQENVCSALF